MHPTVRLQGPRPGPELGCPRPTHRAWCSGPCAGADCAPAAGACGWGWLPPSGARWLRAGTPGEGQGTHLFRPQQTRLPASQRPPHHSPSLLSPWKPPLSSDLQAQPATGSSSRSGEQGAGRLAGGSVRLSSERGKGPLPSLGDKERTDTLHGLEAERPRYSPESWGAASRLKTGHPKTGRGEGAGPHFPQFLQKERPQSAALL